MVGGWMPWSSRPLAMSMALTPVFLWSFSSVMTNSCIHQPLYAMS